MNKWRYLLAALGLFTLLAGTPVCAGDEAPTLLDEPGYVLGKDCKGDVVGSATVGEPGNQLRSSVGSLATITPGAPHAYGTWSTTEFEVKSEAGTFDGYCAQPNSATPSGTFRVSRLDNDVIKSLLLFAPGGDFYFRDFWNAHGNNPATGGTDGNDAISLAHACIGYAYEGTTTGLSDTDIKELNMYINDAKYAMQMEGFDQYTAYVAYNSAQDIVWVERNPTGSLAVEKSSADPGITDGNDCYSLEGAEYGVYTDSACEKQTATLDTDSSGKSVWVTLDARTYYVKETVAPKGFALDKKVHKVKVGKGQKATLKVKDLPTMDPVGVLLGKVDKETNQNKPQGSASLEGALFQIKYYKGLYDIDPAGQGQTAERTWVFRTDGRGFCDYKSDFLESGDELYMSAAGIPMLPVGTITLQETKAPEGYLLNPEIFVVQITSNNDGSEFVYTYNAPTIPENILKVDVVKKEKGKDKVIPGVVFRHTLPDKSTEQATTDSKGRLSFKGLTKGTHVLEEVSVPDGYTINPGKVTFSVGDNGKITVVSNTATAEHGGMKFTVKGDGSALLEVEDALASYRLLLHKQNETGKKLQGAEFTFYADKSCKDVVAKATTAGDGTAVFGNLEVGRKYYLKETKAPQGYRIPVNPDGSDIIYEITTKSDPLSGAFEFYVNGKKNPEVTGDKANRTVNLTVVNRTGVRMPETGSPLTLVVIVVGACCMLGALAYYFINRKRGKKDE